MEDIENLFPAEHDPDFHAPTDYVIKCREQRVERKRRDREDLQDTWRAEVRRRRREQAQRFFRSWS